MPEHAPPIAPSARDLWRSLAGDGRLRALFPEPARRTSAGRRPAAQPLLSLVRELGGAYPIGTVLALCPQLAVALPVLDGGRATSAPAERAWTAALAGDAMTALAVTDAGAAGSDLGALATSVVIDDQGLLLRGEKRWVSAGCFASEALVLARHSEADHFTSFSWVLVPLDAAGVEVRAVDTPHFAEAGLADLRFEARLSADRLVGGVGRGMSGFARHISTERFVSAVWAGVLCGKVIGETLRYASARQVRGAPLAQRDSVRQELARCLVQQRMLEALCRDAVDALDSADATLSAMLLKAAAARTLEHTLDSCARLHGADGFATGGVQSLRAAAAMFGIAGGATELLLDGIADRLPQLVGEVSG